ncbi:hypothetical protein CRG98_025850 [Punica granatum]|uniref:Uncharacterized protein n=1 Tax=Punica granatum TaxID=22663 RepID=A0A2I0JCQ9_PUNGR|nr:hypothetical protein CRG98_025850 [Punica granatum]
MTGTLLERIFEIRGRSEKVWAELGRRAGLGRRGRTGPNWDSGRIEPLRSELGRVGCWAEWATGPNGLLKRTGLRSGLDWAEPKGIWAEYNLISTNERDYVKSGIRMVQTDPTGKGTPGTGARWFYGSSGWPRLTTMLRAFERRPKVVEGNSDPACIYFDLAKTIRPG